MAKSGKSTGPTISSRGTDLLMALGLAGAVMLAYFNVLPFPVIFDDFVDIIANQSIKSIFPIAETLFPEEQEYINGAAGRPLVNFSYAINWAISGASLWSYRVVNIIIHFLCGLTLFAIIRRTLKTTAMKARYGTYASHLAFFIAFIWLLHPIQTSTITPAFRRPESMAGLFFLCTLYFSILGFFSDKRNFWHFLAAASFILGVSSKETAVAAPFVVLAWAYVFLRQKGAP